jgi:hypothetical protein
MRRLFYLLPPNNWGVAETVARLIFWGYPMSKYEGIENETTDGKECSRSKIYVFKKLGRAWLVIFDGVTTTLEDKVGMKYLQYYLRHPNKKISVVDIASFLDKLPSTSMLPSRVDPTEAFTEEAGYSFQERPLAKTDHETIRSLVNRSIELKKAYSELEVTSEESPLVSGERSDLLYEIEQIEDYLLKNAGKFNRNRKADTSLTKTQNRVTKAIREVLKDIEECHPKLHEHLKIFFINSRDGLYFIPTKILWDTGITTNLVV